MAKRKPLVSVFCLTFNQKDYIRECLDGILSQQVDFTYEILINDDASTDGTTEILKEYRDKHPDTIKLVLHTKNQFSQGKRSFILRYLLPHARGDYFAICEGDDYWTDIRKLQNQVDFLKARTDYSICFHPVEVHGHKSNKTPQFPQSSEDISLKRLLHENFIHTNSVMYRRQTYEDASTDVMPADWYLNLFHARFGKIGFIDKPMAVYRQHDGSMWASIRDDDEKFWRKFGSMHLVFHARILQMYGEDDGLRKIIQNNISATIKAITTNVPESDSIIETALMHAPVVASVVIYSLEAEIKSLRGDLIQRDRQLHHLQKSIEQTRLEMEILKSSKIWKLRNALVVFLGKKRL